MWLSLMVLGACGDGRNHNNKEHGMSIELRQLIESKNWQATDVAHQIGDTATVVLLDLLHSPDGEVREIVIACFNETGGEQAAMAFVQVLDDVDINVRRRAMGYLKNHHSTSVLPDLYKDLDQNEDEDIRIQVPLVIGLIRDKRSIPELKRRLSGTTSTGVLRNIRLALARFGEQPFLAEVLQELKAESSLVRLQGLRDLDYLGDERLLVQATQLLEDTTEVINIAPPPRRRMMRLCDVMVNTVANVTKRRFSFDAHSQQVFSDLQIAEIKDSILGVLTK